MIKFMLTKEGKIIDCLFDKEEGRLSHDYTCEVLKLDGDRLNKYSTGMWTSLYGVEGLMQLTENPFVPTMKMIDDIQNHIIKTREDRKKEEIKRELEREQEKIDCEKVNINDYLKDTVNSICDGMELPDEYRNKEKLVNLIEHLNGMNGTTIYFFHNGEGEKYFDRENRCVERRHKWWRVIFKPRYGSSYIGCGLEDEYEDILLDTFCEFIFLYYKEQRTQDMRRNLIKEDLHKIVKYGLDLYTKWAIVKI